MLSTGRAAASSCVSAVTGCSISAPTTSCSQATPRTSRPASGLSRRRPRCCVPSIPSWSAEMSGPTAIRFYGELWHRALDGLRADALDCLQANLAALADLHPGPGPHLALGSVLAFAPAARPLRQRIDQAGDLVGLRVVHLWDD